MPDVTDLLLMQQKLRACASAVELGYLVVNESRKIIDYQCAVLWVPRQGLGRQQGHAAAVSGIPAIVPNTPFFDWIGEVCRATEGFGYERATPVSGVLFAPVIGQRWQEFLPAHGLWLPIGNAGQGGLLLTRGTPFSEADASLADYWAGAVSHALAAFDGRASRVPVLRSGSRARLALVVMLSLFILSMFLRVEQSVNAQAEIVPYNPQVVRSTLDGIIGQVKVKPNQLVGPDEVLLTFDATTIKTQLDVVRQELEIARAEYRRANQQGIADRRAATALPVLKARIEQREAELAYTLERMARTEIRAESQGIVILPDIQALEGKPVKIGEKLLVIAAPEAVEIEFWLAVGDSIALTDEARVVMFPNVAPDTAYSGNIRYVNFQAEVSPEGVFAFRGRASLSPDNQLPRIGWRGTVKIYGERVSVLYYLLRRPIAALRQWSGV
jgi:hypothetical protein